ncbi:hypothetical protein NDN08_005358 [Rhodosorus marinus]|uniref:Secreted protein n=1 Tax=Rhodosorus marinus TaxID=101924 RepID=A0AAV8V3Q2_9RHOD|nr:hypothetical protein NDN08_005358 [Rhodosorus marinus]
MRVLSVAAIVLSLLTNLACGSGVSLSEDALSLRRSNSSDLRICSDYTSNFDNVELGDGDEKCYVLVNSGRRPEFVGTVCTTVDEENDKTCVKFNFTAKRGWKFLQAYAGIQGDCRNRGNKRYQERRTRGPKSVMVLSVCLSEFKVPEGSNGEGCCNTDLCMYMKVKSRKVGRRYTKWAYPQKGKEQCAIRSYRDVVSCTQRLNCENDANETQMPNTGIPGATRLELEPMATAMPMPQ